jgi:hypothetical protein
MDSKLRISSAIPHYYPIPGICLLRWNGLNVNSEQFRVLLVEDNAGNTYWMKLMLTELGLELRVTVATDGA